MQRREGCAVHAEYVQSDVQAFSRHLPCAAQGAGCWLLVASCGLCTAVSSDRHGLVIKKKQGRRKKCTLDVWRQLLLGGSGQGKVTLRKTTSNKHTVDG
jgi:hypothetical protein